mgnify:CR=1 FL=1
MVCRIVAPPALLVCNLHRVMAVRPSAGRLQREAFSRTTLQAPKVDQRFSPSWTPQASGGQEERLTIG